MTVNGASALVKAARESTYSVGSDFERTIYEYFQSEINSGNFFANSQSCRLFRQKGYFSKDRASNIMFDISIEIYLPGSSDYSLLVLIECKKYSTSVSVDNVEEFFAKVQQVAAANCKAIVASTSAFQSGASSFAKSKGMGLLRHFDRESVKWELHRSPSRNAGAKFRRDSLSVMNGLLNPEFRSNVFDLYMQTPSGFTNSFWEFFHELILSGACRSELHGSLLNKRRALGPRVPFLSSDRLERKGKEVVAAIGYAGGEVKLSELCEREEDAHNLVVCMGMPRDRLHNDRSVLGRIIFQPPRIEIYAQFPEDIARERFTLAHELAHHLLGHGKYLLSESCDDKDFSLQKYSSPQSRDIVRMEFQANFLASSLLMPKDYFLADFYLLMRVLGIANRGFGALYVDEQGCNIQNYMVVTDQLMCRYGVSRSAARVRLQSLGCLVLKANIFG